MTARIARQKVTGQKTTEWLATDLVRASIGFTARPHPAGVWEFTVEAEAGPALERLAAGASRPAPSINPHDPMDDEPEGCDEPEDCDPQFEGGSIFERQI